MQEIFKIYSDFLTNLPAVLRPVVSLAVAGMLIFSAIAVIKKNFIFIVVLVVLLPAALPVLREVLNIFLTILRFVVRGG